MKRQLEERRAKAKASFMAAGAERNKRENAKNFLLENVAPEIIARCTGLSLEEVLELRKRFKSEGLLLPYWAFAKPLLPADSL